MSDLIDSFLESFLRLPCFRTFFFGTFPQTTRVLPGSFFLSALKRPRTAGTDPPAGGLTEVSAAGSGQYEARSMCARASAGSATSSPSASAIAIDRRLRIVDFADLPVTFAPFPLLVAYT